MAEENNETNGATLLKKTKHRSPNYPAIGLEKALERVETLYEQGKLHGIPISAARQMWNYKTGTGNQIVAALKGYGLVEVTGEGDSRQIRVTETARKILKDHPDRSELLKEAAIKPELHKELWEKYDGDFPVDTVIKNYLIFERNFNENFVDDFINQFRATIAFAKLVSSDKIPDRNDEEQWQGGDMLSNTPSAAKTVLERERGDREQKATPPAGQRDFPLYLTNRQKGGLYIPAEMSQKDYDLLKQQIDNHLAIILLTSVVSDDEKREQ